MRGAAQVPLHKKLLSIDATTIELCASVFDWARSSAAPRAAVKLHLMLDHDGLLRPRLRSHNTDGKQHEVTVTRQWEFAPGTILVFDRGYTDYNWFERLTQQGVYFVTRLKTNAGHHRSRGSGAAPAQGTGERSDHPA